jgi:hypothetical protein
MALFGSIGSALGLGTTKQVVGGLTQVGQSLPIIGTAVEGISNIFGGITGGSQQGQSVAVEAPKQTLPQETQQSSQAAIGGILPTVPALTGAGRLLAPSLGRFFGSPAGQIAVGGGIGAGLSMLRGDGEPAKIRFTRKQQMQVKEMVELLGFDGAMQVLGVDASTLAFMLTKKFPRRGQGITAAQLRNAQRVNNKIVHMHDKLKSSFGAATRRTTARRSTTRVTQIKN